MSFGLSVNCKVKRLGPACCGMEVGKIYDAYLCWDKTYLKVRLPDGSWTGDHWIGNNGIKYFEILKKDPK